MSGSESRTMGAYRLGRRLGVSATGAVFLAEGPRDAQHGPGQVVVKLLPGPADGPVAREMARQVRAVAALEHPGVVPLFGLAQDGTDTGIVMAYAPGGSLSDVLARGGSVSLPLALGVVSRMVGQLARTLLAAHKIGIVHGNLRPSNVFVRTSPRGRPLAALADFGQAAQVTRTAQALVSATLAPTAGQIGGYVERLRYAAPEQFHGIALPASDQYALALLACEWLTAQYPVAGDGPALLANLARGAVDLASLASPALDGAVRPVLARALAATPEQRYASIEEFAERLEDALAVGVPISGVTMEMASLGQDTGTSRGVLSPMGSSGVRRAGSYIQAAGGSGLLVQPSESHAGVESLAVAQELDLPTGDAPQKTRKRMAIFAVIAVVLALSACSFGVFTLDRGVALRVPTTAGSFAGPNVASKQSLSTTSVISSKDASTGQATLAQLTTRQPTFTDVLATNSQHWQTSSAVFFSDQRLHIVNNDTTTIVAATVPHTATGTAFAAQVNLSVVHGYPSDSAGMRFFVQKQPDGTEAYYAYLISSEGRFGVWLNDSDAARPWTLLSGGYSSALKTGMGATNALAVAVDSGKRSVYVFANGQCIARVPLSSEGPRQGQVGLMVLDGGAEAAFSQYAIFNG